MDIHSLCKALYARYFHHVSDPIRSGLYAINNIGTLPGIRIEVGSDGKISYQLTPEKDYEDDPHPVDPNHGKLVGPVKISTFLQRNPGLLALMQSHNKALFLGNYVEMTQRHPKDGYAYYSCVDRVNRLMKEQGYTYKGSTMIQQVIDFVSSHWKEVAGPFDFQAVFVEDDGDFLEVYTDIHTCMSGNPALEFFLANDGIELIAIKHQNGTLAGRCLLWDIKPLSLRGKTYTKLLDRVYPSDKGPWATFARNVAKKEGWLYRKDDTANNNQIVYPDDGASVGLRVVHEYLHPEGCKIPPPLPGYPYLDTLWLHAYKMREDGRCVSEFYNIPLSRGRGTDVRLANTENQPVTLGDYDYDCAYCGNPTGEHHEDWSQNEGYLVWKSSSYSKARTPCEDCIHDYALVETVDGQWLEEGQTTEDYQGNLIPRDLAVMLGTYSRYSGSYALSHLTHRAYPNHRLTGGQRVLCDEAVILRDGTRAVADHTQISEDGLRDWLPQYGPQLTEAVEAPVSEEEDHDFELPF